MYPVNIYKIQSGCVKSRNDHFFASVNYSVILNWFTLFKIQLTGSLLIFLDQAEEIYSLDSDNVSSIADGLFINFNIYNQPHLCWP